MLLLGLSTGTTVDQNGVGEGIIVAVVVGSGVNVGGMGEGVNVGRTDVGIGVEAGAHPLNKTVSTTNAKNTD